MKKVGILGGMGPLATVDLFNKIVIMTNANCDNDHIHILIDNNTEIPDRTSFILGDGEDPTPELIKSATTLESMGADFIVIPCNTAHHFYKFVQDSVSIPVINMIEETAKFIVNMNLNSNKVGLISTTGTIFSGVYDTMFKKYNLEIVKPDTKGQQVIMDLIYGVKEGNTDFDLNSIYKVLENLSDSGCSYVILGCTELPVAFQTLDIKGDFIDPTRILAQAAIDSCLATNI
ncbi:MAG: aspartate/glutamate racemase family protein [Paraclostridium sp.]